MIGPDATTAAKVGFGDVVSTLFEAAVAVGCVVLIRSHLQRHGARSYRSEVLSVVVALGTTLLTTLALFSAVGGRPFVSHVG